MIFLCTSYGKTQHCAERFRVLDIYFKTNWVQQKSAVIGEVYEHIRYAGLQGGTDCYCGNAFAMYGKVENMMCNMPCAGDSTAMCGGSMLNSVYSTMSIYGEHDSLSGRHMCMCHFRLYQLSITLATFLLELLKIALNSVHLSVTVTAGIPVC